MCWIYLPNFDMLLNFLKCNYFHKKKIFFSHPTSLNLFSIYSSSYISTLYFHLKMYLLFIAIFFFFLINTIYCLLDQLLQESAAGDNNIQDVIDNNIIYISLALQDWLASSTDKVANTLQRRSYFSFLSK